MSPRYDPVPDLPPKPQVQPGDGDTPFLPGATHFSHQKDTEGLHIPASVHYGRVRAPNSGQSCVPASLYGVYLPETLEMVCSIHACLWVVLETLLVRDHPSAHFMDSFSKALTERKMNLEE